MTESLFWVAVGAFCILASLGLLIRARLEHMASMSWPTTEGRLVQTNVKRIAGGDGDYFVIRPVYRYRVNGRTYEGSRIMFGPETRYGKEVEAQRALDDFKDPTPTVHYDPRRPQDSVLKVRLDGGEYIFMAVCGLIPLIGGLSGAFEKAGAAL